MARKSALSLLFFGLFIFSPPAGAEEILRVVNGRVKEVFPERGELVLSYLHPVSGQAEELVLKVDGGTGFSEGIQLKDLEGNEPVSIDYQEDGQGNARAVQIKRVPLSGVPLEKNPFL